jgi:riboflavin kinase/FMN adenylyltransferase
VSLAIGVFDGVHRGHREVLSRTLAEARSRQGVAVAVTFDRHPNAVLAPERTPLLLWPVWRRLDAFAELGFDAALVFVFDAGFSRQSAGEFLDRLIGGFGRVASVSVGSTFVFGRGREGNLDLLRRRGAEAGFAVHGIPPLEQDGEVVSSTRVRECVAAGDLDRATALLGRPYTLAGEVVAGDRLGRQLGFPTANLAVSGLVLPPLGVYAAMAVAPGLRVPAAVNIGRRPTVDPGASVTRVEAHLLDFSGDLYGRRLDLEVHGRVRGEERFGSREALVARIGADVDVVREWAGKRGLP